MCEGGSARRVTAFLCGSLACHGGAYGRGATPPVVAAATSATIGRKDDARNLKGVAHEHTQRLKARLEDAELLIDLDKAVIAQLKAGTPEWKVKAALADLVGDERSDFQKAAARALAAPQPGHSDITRAFADLLAAQTRKSGKRTTLNDGTPTIDPARLAEARKQRVDNR